MNLNQVTLPALNIAESNAFYKKIGFVQIVESEHYARFECGTGDSTFSIHKVDSVPEDTGVMIYCPNTLVQNYALSVQGFS